MNYEKITKNDKQKVEHFSIVKNTEKSSNNSEFLQRLREKVIENNKKRQEICFPSKKIKNDKTGEITYQNIPNKFDFSNQLSNTYQK